MWNFHLKLSLWGQHLVLKGKKHESCNYLQRHFIARGYALAFTPVTLFITIVGLLIAIPLITLALLLMVIMLPFVIICMPCICASENGFEKIVEMMLGVFRLIWCVGVVLPLGLLVTVVEMVFCLLHAFIAPEIGYIIPVRYLTKFRSAGIDPCMCQKTRPYEKQTLYRDMV